MSESEQGNADSESLQWAARALLAVLCLAAATAVVYWVLLVTYEWDWFVGESINAYFADRFVHGDALYADWNQHSLIFPIYPPGLYWALSPLEAVTGYQLWPGRLLAFGAFLFAAFASFRISRRLGCDTGEALASGLGVFAFSLVSVALIAANRPDGLAIGFAAGALLAITKWEGDRSRAALLLAAAACVAMIATKQNFAVLAAALVAAVWLRDRRDALLFSVSVAAGCGVVFGVAQVTSDGAFLRNMRDFTGTYSWSALRGVLEGSLLPFPNPLLAIGAIETAIALRHWRSARAVHWAWLASFGVVISALKLGSGPNYWVATDVTSAILLGPALQRIRIQSGQAGAGAVAALIALLLVPQTVQGVRDVKARHADLPDFNTLNAEAAERLDRIRGAFFGDRTDLALEAGRKPVFDTSPFRHLARTGEWDPTVVARRIKARQFAVIQSSFDLRANPIPTYQGIPLWPPPIVNAARHSYCESWSARFRSGTAPGIWLYRPCRESKT